MFGNGSRFSVEFTELAPPEFTGDVLDDERAFRGRGGIDFERLIAMGISRSCVVLGSQNFDTREVITRTSARRVGRVFRLIDVAYEGP